MPYNFNYFDHLIDELPHLTRRKLANNTYVRRLPDDTIAIRLHETDIVIVRPDDTFMLNSGGWRTYTTKDRINKFSPARVYQERNQWYMWPGPIPFFDGIVVNMRGEPLDVDQGEVEAALADQKKLDKWIARMIRTLRKLDTLPHPNNGDCWGCFMMTDSGERPMGTNCVLDHLKENYLHGSLIYRAMQWAGYRPEGISIHWHAWSGERSWSKETIVRVMRRFLRHEGQRIIAMQKEVERIG